MTVTRQGRSPLQTQQAANGPFARNGAADVPLRFGALSEMELASAAVAGRVLLWLQESCSRSGRLKRKEPSRRRRLNN